MICMYTHVTARVMCIYPLYCCDGDVCLHHDLVTMHALWLSHCKSSWSCMNWKLGSKHLDVMHDIIPHAATKCSTTKWSEGPTLRDERCVKNSPTCYALLNGGFMAILRRTDCFILIWTCNAVLAVSHHCHFSKLPPIQKQNPQKQERSFVLLPCCPRTMLRNDACEAVW